MIHITNYTCVCTLFLSLHKRKSYKLLNEKKSKNQKTRLLHNSITYIEKKLTKFALYLSIILFVKCSLLCSSITKSQIQIQIQICVSCAIFFLSFYFATHNVVVVYANQNQPYKICCNFLQSFVYIVLMIYYTTA